MGLVNKAAKWLVKKGMGVPAFWFQRGIELGSQEVLSEPMKSSVWVQNAITKIAGPVASVPVCFFKPDSELAGVKGRRVKAFRTSTGIVRKAIEDQIDVPLMNRLLRSPLHGMGYADFVEASVGWFCMAGEWFWVPVDRPVPFPEARAAGGKVPEIIVARPDRMRAVIQNRELVAWEFRDGQQQERTIEPTALIQEKRFNPYDRWRGLSQYESAQVAAEGDWLAGKFARNLMANNGDTGPYIIAKNGIPTDPQREQILADLRAKRAAQQRGDFRPIFLTGDITVEDAKVKAVDAEFIAMRLNSREEVFAAFNVPPSLSQVKEAYSIGSASDFYQLITTACIPMGEKFADALERLTLMLTGQEVEILLDWDEHPVMQEVRKERFASVDTFWNKGMPLEKIDEFLALGLPKFPGWDVGYLPINVTTVEQASQPEPEPAANAALAERLNAENRNPNEEEDPGPVKAMSAALRGHSREPIANSQTKALHRKRIWAGQMRARSGIVKAYQSKASKVLNEFRAIALRKLEQHGAAMAKGMERGAAEREALGVGKAEGASGSLIDFIFNPIEFGKHLVFSVNPVAQMAIETATLQTLAEIGRPDDPWRMPPPGVKGLIMQRKDALEKVGATVRDQLNTQLAEGYEGGESTAELMDRIRGKFNDLSRAEAKRIAVTETNIVYGAAAHDTAINAGVRGHRWFAEEGARPDHEAAGEEYGDKAIPIDEPFNVGGELLMHPGDPSGSAGNIINCRCTEFFDALPAEKEE